METRDQALLPQAIEARHGTHAGKSAGNSLVAVLMLIATILGLLLEAPAFFAVWQGPLTYGFAVNPHTMTINHVAEPEASEGVKNGMIALTNGQSAWRLANPLPDSRLVVRDDVHSIEITARHVPTPPIEVAVVSLSYLTSFAILIFAGALCYQRPGVMTVTFWLFALANCEVGWIATFYKQLPENLAQPLIRVLNATIGGFGNFPLVWFALRFPDDKLRSRGMRIVDYMWSATALAALLWFLFRSGTANEFWTYTVPQNAPLPIALAVLLWLYVRSTEAVRQRAVWAIAGIMATTVLWLVSDVVNEASPGSYPLIGSVTTLVATMCPLALVYAVFRHQLLGISFVVNRALVFSSLTAFIVGVVALADYVIGKFLAQTRAALIVEAAVTIAVGYALQYVHGALEQFVERVVFARRHAAEKHIDRIIAGLAYAKTRRAVLNALVEEPRTTLDLQSAGVFIVDDGVLKLMTHHGWHVAGTPAIELDDPLARILLTERNVVDIAESRWHAAIPGFAPGALQIAVPLLARSELLGVAFYGHHRDGSSIDPEERATLHRLCQAAAVAYAAVEFAHMRDELATLRTTLTAP